MASNSPAPAVTSAAAAREYLLERVGEAAVVQVYADGFSALSLREKTLAWHLYRAALAGRDIFYDQRYAHNLEMRDTLEAIVTSDRDVAQAALKGCATGTSVTGGCSPAAAVQAAIEGRATETSVTGGGSPVAAAQAAIEGRATETSVAGGSPVAQAFRPALGDPRLSETLAEICRYTKLFWINTGPYNNLTARKFVLACTPEALAGAAHAAARAGARFPLRDGETLDDLLERLRPMFFDAEFEPTVTCKNPPGGQDILEASANNLYVGVTMQDLDGFVERYPLNSRLVKADGRLVEEVCRVGGRYGAAIAAIVEQLEAAIAYAAEPMAAALRALVAFYQSGEIADREAYDIAWVQDKDSAVDTINGFVEVYLDARSIKGAWEALVFYVNGEKTSQIRTIAANAQWFEDHMPWDPKYRKDGVRSVTANAIDVIVESGESGPITPVGINLPNDQRIRERFGSKSVSLSNVAEAYDKSTLPELRSEFSWTVEEFERAMRWSSFASELTTNMHEVIGHGSGRVAERLDGNPQAALKEQFSAIEESRADLVALYFVADRRLVELDLVPEDDHADVVRAEYEAYARNALVQLRRVREGTTIEEDHMRNRQMIVHWLMAHTAAIDRRTRDGKTYYVVTDVKAFRDGVGELLAEVQRIKGEGDYPAARALFEDYGVHFDASLRDEIVARVDRLQLPSYSGFVMPRLEPVVDAAGAIADVAISYPRDLTAQMLEYSATTRHLRS